MRHFVLAWTFGALACALAFGGDKKDTTSHLLDLSRPHDYRENFVGRLQYVKTGLGEESPFLVLKNGKKLKLETCDEQCQQDIQNCPEGQLCKVNAELFPNGESILVSSFQGLDPNEVRQTPEGSLFYRDRSVPELGEAWRDPQGVIWGDLVKDKEGKPRGMTYVEAVDYCKSIGAELPKAVDWIRLTYHLTDATGYRPGVLPHLGEHRWWTQDKQSDKRHWEFRGDDGSMGAPPIIQHVGSTRLVRCVVATKN